LCILPQAANFLEYPHGFVILDFKELQAADISSWMHCSHGHVKITSLLLTNIADNLLNEMDKSCIEQKNLKDKLNDQLKVPRTGRCLKPKDDPLLCKLVLLELLNKQDEFGNSLLHLAAWNGQQEMYDWLVQQKANQFAVNDFGLTPLTLTVRFGFWEMFKHIRTKHLIRSGWKFGNVILEQDDYSQLDWRSTGTFHTDGAIQKYLNHLAIQYMTNKNNLKCHGIMMKGVLEDFKFKFDEDTMDSVVAKSIDTANALGEEIQENKKRIDLIRTMMNFLQERTKRVNQECQNSRLSVQNENENSEDLFSRIQTVLDTDVSADDVTLKLTDDDQSNIRDSEAFLGAVTIITLFRPAKWYENAHSCVERVVLKKWNKVYGLVHLGNSIIPYIVILVLFCYMWHWRRLSILDHGMWWSDSRVYAPITDPSVEAMCGWRAIRDSKSGRLQAALIIYFVPSLLRLALVQRRLRPMDLDEDGDMVISVEEVKQFMYVNLESLLHISIGGLIIAIGTTRVLAGPDCDSTYLVVEKNTTSMAALLLFVNLLFVARPIKIVGLLVLTLYRFLVTDVFRFLIVYSAFFIAFLIALQMLNNTHEGFLAWMENDEDTLLPKMDKIQDDLRHNSRLGYLDFDMEGCKSQH
jgi:hypothetical protein